MTEATQTSGELNWLLDELVGRVAQIRHAVVLSGDGLPVGASSQLSREDRERFAAIASGFHSLAKGTGMHFEAGGVVQTMVELEGGFLFVVAAGDRSCLAVFAEADADIGLIAYEMARLVKQVHEHLYVPSRPDQLDPATAPK
ncbi:roadblock/LC7 domain-containing protein [Phytoactinopolyspora limicola]|uniref:roadblock/LC7 domain-containing protein n=1 Tax=Phytoactinopolyspora limicola TaxID=2715536 RepID=UPI00140D5A7A|nr:roadblock/LC7 domain-containing protein [Phytoactinopolyspora limicola]